MNNWSICWFSRIMLLGILIFKALIARRLYKSFGVKGLSRGLTLNKTGILYKDQLLSERTELYGVL
jgi:hypothetical protein